MAVSEPGAGASVSGLEGCFGGGVGCGRQAQSENRFGSPVAPW